MKKVILKIGEIVKNIVLFLLKIIFGFKLEEKIKTNKEDNFSSIKPNSENKIKIEEENSDSTESENPRELFYEYINKKKYYTITEEELKEELNKTIEKLFKIKIKKLSNNEKEKLKEYSKKVIKKIQEKIEEKKITNQEELKISLKEKVKKDAKEKGIDVDNKIEQPTFVCLQEDKKEKLEFYQEKKLPMEESNIKKVIVPTINEINILQKETIDTGDKSKEVKKIEGNKEEISREQVVLERKENPVIDENLNLELIQANKEEKEAIVVPVNESAPLDITIEDNQEVLNKKELIVGAPVDLKIVKSVVKESISENKEEKKERKEDKPKENSEKDEKKQAILPVQINFEKIEIQNKKIVEEANQEINKEEFIEKEYDYIEKLIDEKISELENLLTENLTEVQKTKITTELQKLKSTKEKVALFKENDLEKLRISLEETISLEELDLIEKKFKKFQEEEGLKKQEEYFKSIENKSKEEIERMEKLLIKESLRKSLKKLEIPLFLSFPFIKNRFFRKFVSGLFLFRGFQFLKNILFGTVNTYEPLDLSYIQKGSDALENAITITQKNREYLANLKRMTLLKYPELEADEEFLSYINGIEENLQKNYEKLLKHDKVVKKYFHKSNALIRKRKKKF